MNHNHLRISPNSLIISSAALSAIGGVASRAEIQPLGVAMVLAGLGGIFVGQHRSSREPRQDGKMPDIDDQLPSQAPDR
jgi:hypothetical protein